MGALKYSSARLQCREKRTMKLKKEKMNLKIEIEIFKQNIFCFFVFLFFLSNLKEDTDGASCSSSGGSLHTRGSLRANTWSPLVFLGTLSRFLHKDTAVSMYTVVWGEAMTGFKINN